MAWSRWVDSRDPGTRWAEQSIDGLMQNGTGEPLTPRYLIEFLKRSPEVASSEKGLVHR